VTARFTARAGRIRLARAICARVDDDELPRFRQLGGRSQQTHNKCAPAALVHTPGRRSTLIAKRARHTSRPAASSAASKRHTNERSIELSANRRASCKYRANDSRARHTFSNLAPEQGDGRPPRRAESSTCERKLADNN
jgi:hypothetical protein